MKVGFSYCVATSVDVDRFSDAYLEMNVLPVLTHNGEPVTVEQLRVACFDHRNRGFKVFPPCGNVDEQGYCKGHPPEEPDESEDEERWAALFGGAL